jgi:hypothetical protein
LKTHINRTTANGVTSVSIGSDADPLFSSDFDNYKIIIIGASASTASSFSFRLRANTTDLTSSVYLTQRFEATSNTLSADRTTTTSARLNDAHTTADMSFGEFILTNPFNAKNKTFNCLATTSRNDGRIQMTGGTIANTGSYNAITFFSADNLVNVTIDVYGLRK